jgi:hypothetical protein
MVDQTKVVGSKLQLTAVINDTERYDIVSYSSSFEINSIPSGSVMLPVGRALDTGLPAEIMAKFNNFTAKQKIKIYLAVQFDPTVYGAGLEAFVGQAEQLIFEGYITGAILKRTGTSLHIVAHFVHWLSDLNNASVFSGTSHVSNPVALYDLGAEEAYAGVGAGGGAGVDATSACSFAVEEGHWSIVSTAVNLIQGTSDIWKDAMQPFLTCLLSKDSLNPKIQQWFNSDQAKQKRLRALNQIVSGGLVLDPSFTDPAIPYSMSKGIRDGIKNTDANSTVWGLLLGYWGPGYFFAVCPRVTDAILAPLVGSYRNAKGDYKTVEANDYYSIDLNLSARQSIGAIGMRAPTTTQVGIAALSNELSDWPGVYPTLKNDDDRYNGVFLSREMPFWLTQVTFEPPSINPATPPSTAFAPPVVPGAGIGNAITAAARIAQLGALQQTLAERFARFFYVNEVFNNRSCDVSGKLRFDVCPGTTLKVQAIALDTSTSGVDRFYGQVIRVSYTIDATQGTASTVFTLSNLRTESEVADKVFSIEKPPLYATAWSGDKLI